MVIIIMKILKKHHLIIFSFHIFVYFLRYSGYALYLFIISILRWDFNLVTVAIYTYSSNPHHNTTKVSVFSIFKTTMMMFVRHVVTFTAVYSYKITRDCLQLFEVKGENLYLFNNNESVCLLGIFGDVCDACWSQSMGTSSL